MTGRIEYRSHSRRDTDSISKKTRCTSTTHYDDNFGVKVLWAKIPLGRKRQSSQAQFGTMLVAKSICGLVKCDAKKGTLLFSAMSAVPTCVIYRTVYSVYKTGTWRYVGPHIVALTWPHFIEVIDINYSYLFYITSSTVSIRFPEVVEKRGGGQRTSTNSPMIFKHVSTRQRSDLEELPPVNFR